jgi:hypothetical protein
MAFAPSNFALSMKDMGFEACVSSPKHLDAATGMPARAIPPGGGVRKAARVSRPRCAAELKRGNSNARACGKENRRINIVAEAADMRTRAQLLKRMDAVGQLMRRQGGENGREWRFGGNCEMAATVNFLNH